MNQVSEYNRMHILELLKNKEIDIYKPNYKKAKNYKNIADELIFVSCYTHNGINIECNRYMRIEEFIERFLLSEKDATKHYDCKYDMGNKVKLKKEDCSYAALAREIDKQKLKKEVEKNIKFPNSKNSGECQSEKENVAINFYRKNGYVDQIKSHLNIDLNSFDKGNLKYQSEKFKILYLFYKLNTKDFPKTRIIELIGKKSMENIDNTSLGWETNNGEVIKIIKSNLEKEMDLQSISNIKNAIREIVILWDTVIESYLYDSEVSYGLGLTDEIDEEFEIDMLIDSLESAKYKSSENLSSKTGFSPVELLYLRILQYEQLGQIEDLKKINAIKPEANYNVPSEMIPKMKEFSKILINSSDIENYILENLREIDKYVYLKNDVNKEERRRIRENTGKQKKLLSFFLRAKPLFDIGEVPVLLVVSCLQAILIDSKNETFDYVFHGYQDTKSHKPKVNAALKKDGQVLDALKMYWVSKVNFHWYSNIGRYEFICNINKLVNVCDNILLHILNSDDDLEMKDKNKFYCTVFLENICI